MERSKSILHDKRKTIIRWSFTILLLISFLSCCEIIINYSAFLKSIEPQLKQVSKTIDNITITNSFMYWVEVWFVSLSTYLIWSICYIWDTTAKHKSSNKVTSKNKN